MNATTVSVDAAQQSAAPIDHAALDVILSHLERRYGLDPRIDRVTVADVRTYLLNRSWRLRPFPGPELLVFEGPKDDDGEPIIQVLPSSVRLRDYRMRVEDLIGALSVIESRPAVDILNDMLSGAQTNGAAGQHPDGVKAESK